jgi:hypothetical protein
LYFLWVGGGGLSIGAISDIQRALGLESTTPGSSASITKFDDIWSSSLFSSLAPDQFVQIGWYVRTSAPTAPSASYTHHALIAGRLSDGTWFWSDQGPSPAREFNTKTFPELEKVVRAAAATGYWIFTGGLSDFTMFVVGGWTGIKLLTGPGAVARKLTDLVPLGSFLAEIDAGALTAGDRVNASAAVGRAYTLADAEALFSARASLSSALIIEMPAGVFHTYEASAVSTANVNETAIDASDSAGGVLARHDFVHAWLILGDGRGKHGKRWQVY